SAGLKELVGLAVGLPAVHPANDRYAVEAGVESAKTASMRQAAGKAGYDARLYDDALWSKVQPLLTADQQAAAASWAQMQDKIELPPGLTPQQKADALARLRNENLEKTVLADPALEKLSPGLGKAVADRLRAQVVVEEETNAFEAEVETFSAETRDRLRSAQPVKSRVPEWLAAKTNEAVERYRAASLPFLYGKIETELKAQGLAAEAAAFAGERAFDREAAPGVRAGLQAPTAPDRVFQFGRRYWLKSHWRVQKSDYQGGTFYSVDRYQRFSVASSRRLWRIENGLARTLTWWNNGLYHLLVGNLWNGPLGLRSLVSSRPFAYRWDVDSSTGK
ncbi:MAG: hypothetical protein KGR26_17085, partial [Cyanobacteria bacterium REEB65]|nr:hypothetical protein [Cyanobacteria bacterium REEB65]